MPAHQPSWWHDLFNEAVDAAIAHMRRTVRARMGDERTHVVDEFLAERRADAEAEGHD